jgi:hypothetical protein
VIYNETAFILLLETNQNDSTAFSARKVKGEDRGIGFKKVLWNRSQFFKLQMLAWVTSSDAGKRFIQEVRTWFRTSKKVSQ